MASVRAALPRKRAARRGSRPPVATRPLARDLVAAVRACRREAATHSCRRTKRPAACGRPCEGSDARAAPQAPRKHQRGKASTMLNNLCACTRVYVGTIAYEAGVCDSDTICSHTAKYSTISRNHHFLAGTPIVTKADGNESRFSRSSHPNDAVRRCGGFAVARAAQG